MSSVVGVLRRRDVQLIICAGIVGGLVGWGVATYLLRRKRQGDSDA
jgi:hypothetical protein